MSSEAATVQTTHRLEIASDRMMARNRRGPAHSGGHHVHYRPPAPSAGDCGTHTVCSGGVVAALGVGEQSSGGEQRVQAVDERAGSGLEPSARLLRAQTLHQMVQVGKVL